MGASSRGAIATALALAHAFLAGEWDEASLLARGQVTFGRRPRWLRRVVRETLAAYRTRPVDRPRELARFVAAELESQHRGAGRRSAAVSPRSTGLLAVLRQIFGPA